MITLGADPEVFVTSVDGNIVPGCGLIGGTKLNPLDLGDGYAIQEDNVMAEFNVPPVNVEEEGVYTFVRVMERARKRVVAHLSKHHLTPIWGVAYHEFAETDLLSKQAQEFGCSPDFDAYNNGAPAPKVDPKEIGRLRFAGGHLHIGHEVKIPPFVMASFLDATVGLESIYYRDSQGPRRTYYGQAGRFRPTPYGIEYRTLSNFWIHNSEMVQLVGERAAWIVTKLQKATPTDIKRWFTEIPWADVQRIINEEDRTMSQRLSSYLRDQVWGTPGGMEI